MSDHDGAAKRRRERRLRSWAKQERQTVAMALAEALHHSAPRRPKTARTGVRPGVLEDPGLRRETEHEQHAALRGPKPPSPGVPSLATPVLAGQATEGMDSATLRFLTASALRRTKEEEEQAKVKRNEEEKEERRMKRINEMLRFELPVSLEEREAWRRWIASSSSSSSGNRRKRKKRRKRKVPKSSSSCSSRSSRVARAARTQNSGHYFRARCLVRQWIHFLTSILVAFGATPGTRQSFVRCWVLLRSRRTMVFWEMTQCFRISVMFGTTVDTILRQSTWFLLAPCIWQSPVLCLTRHSATLVVDSGGGMCLLILLVITHFALYSLLLFSGPDARHHGRYEPEGRLCCDTVWILLGDDFLELFVLSAMLSSTVALGDDFRIVSVFSAMLGSTVALGDDFLELFVLSAMLGSTVDTCRIQSTRRLEEFHTFST